MKDGYVQKPHNGKARRWVQTMELRDNPALIAEYRKRHSLMGIWGQDGLPSSEDIRMTTRKSHD